jgi:hypothetical protein
MGPTKQQLRELGIADQLEYDHKHLIGTYGDCDGKDWIAEVESYYMKKPSGYRSKVRMADHIPKDVQDHVVLHIAAALSKRKAPRVRRLTLRDFIRNPLVQRVQTQKFYFEKVHYQRGYSEVVKRDKKSGRFAPFSQREKAQLVRAQSGSQHKRGSGRQEAK